MTRILLVEDDLYQIPLNGTHAADSQTGANMIHHGKRRRFAMAAAVRVRGDYDAVQLRELAKRSDDADQTRRLLALAAVYDGGPRTEGPKIRGVAVPTARDRGFSFNPGGP